MTKQTRCWYQLSILRLTTRILFPCCELHLSISLCSASNLVNFTLLLNSCLAKTCLVVPHVVNKAVEVQFKTKSAEVKEMLALEIKGRDRRGGSRRLQTKQQQVPARLHVMVGGSQNRAWANVDILKSRFWNALKRAWELLNSRSVLRESKPGHPPFYYFNMLVLWKGNVTQKLRKFY